MAFGSFAGGLAGGFASGLKIGRQVKKDWEEDELKADLRSAATTGMVENQTSGDEALSKFKENYVPQEGGPQTADEYIAQNPQVFAGMQGRKAGFAVQGQTFDSVDDARDHARGLNMSAMGRVYAQHGDPEKGARLEAEARQQALQGLQLKSAKRKDVDEEFRSNLDSFIRNSANLSDQEFLTQAASLATNGKQDNLGFAYEVNPQTGQVEILQHDRGTRQVTGRQPWDGDRNKVVSALLKYSGAAGFDAARREDKADGRYDKEFGLKERELAVKEEANRINDAYRKGIISIQERELGLRRLALGQSQGGSGRVNPAQVMQEKAQAYASALVGAGEFPNTPEGQAAALKKSYGLILRDPADARPAKSVTPDDRIQALTYLQGMNPKFDSLPLSEKEDAVNGVLGLPTGMDMLRAAKAAQQRRVLSYEGGDLSMGSASELATLLEQQAVNSGAARPRGLIPNTGVGYNDLAATPFYGGRGRGAQ